MSLKTVIIDFRYHIISTKSLSRQSMSLSSNLVTNEIIITIVVTMSSLTQLASNMITNMIIMSSGQGKGGLGEATGAELDICIRTEGKMAKSIGITDHFHLRICIGD